MRIGNLEDMEKTRKTSLPEETSEAEPPAEGQASTSSQASFWNSEKGRKWKNWWYYHKWYVICGALILGIAGSLIGNALGLWKKKPDFQIAYVGQAELPQDTISALEQVFTSLAEDYNKDGEILIQVNQYISSALVVDAELSFYGYASEIYLISDITDCESYFFLMDDPAYFQSKFQVLASPDGSCPQSEDNSVEDKVFPWADCPLLSQMELGNYSTTMFGEEKSGNNQEILSTLFVGRRCFYNDNVTENASQCDALWNLLYNSL